MGVATKAEDFDMCAYWTDVNDALTDVCDLSEEEAAAAVSVSRQALMYLSDLGRLLAYHDSVPQVVEDIWKQGPGADAQKSEVENVRKELIKWYSERNKKRGLPG